MQYGVIHNEVGRAGDGGHFHVQHFRAKLRWNMRAAKRPDGARGKGHNHPLPLAIFNCLLNVAKSFRR